MQQVLIKLLQACWNIVDVSNNKFDEMISVLGTLFDHLKVEAPTAKAYDALSNKINTRFQKVFERLSEVQSTARLASDVGPSKARVGEGPSRKVRTI